MTWKKLQDNIYNILLRKLRSNYILTYIRLGWLYFGTNLSLMLNDEGGRVEERKKGGAHDRPVLQQWGKQVSGGVVQPVLHPWCTVLSYHPEPAQTRVAPHCASADSPPDWTHTDTQMHTQTWTHTHTGRTGTHRHGQTHRHGHRHMCKKVFILLGTKNTQNSPLIRMSCGHFLNTSPVSFFFPHTFSCKKSLFLV